MLERHRETVESADVVTVVRVSRYFGLRRAPGGSLHDALNQRGLSQADLVLCLLRLNAPAALRLAERLVGRPITRCPSSLLLGWRWLRAERRNRRAGDDRLVTIVYVPDPELVLPGGGLARRLSEVRAGMSVAQLVARGLRRRDIRLAVRRGVFELEVAA